MTAGTANGRCRRKAPPVIRRQRRQRSARATEAATAATAVSARPYTGIATGVTAATAATAVSAPPVAQAKDGGLTVGPSGSRGPKAGRTGGVGSAGVSGTPGGKGGNGGSGESSGSVSGNSGSNGGAAGAGGRGGAGSDSGAGGTGGTSGTGSPSALRVDQAVLAEPAAPAAPVLPVAPAVSRGSASSAPGQGRAGSSALPVRRTTGARGATGATGSRGQPARAIRLNSTAVHYWRSVTAPPPLHQQGREAAEVGSTAAAGQEQLELPPGRQAGQWGCRADQGNSGAGATARQGRRARWVPSGAPVVLAVPAATVVRCSVTAAGQLRWRWGYQRDRRRKALTGRTPQEEIRTIKRSHTGKRWGFRCRQIDNPVATANSAPAVAARLQAKREATAAAASGLWGDRYRHRWKRWNRRGGSTGGTGGNSGNGGWAPVRISSAARSAGPAGRRHWRHRGRWRNRRQRRHGSRARLRPGQ